MKIVVSGACGYIGSQLLQTISFFHDDIVAIDNLYYNQGPLVYQILNNPCIKLVHCDAFSQTALPYYKEADVVIPLAAIVGAPACDANQKLATRINLDYIEWLCHILSDDQWIIFPNTNSAYGKSTCICTEESLLNPISLYATLKQQAEDLLLERERSICFRLATVFGVSARHRLDLLVNNLVYRAMNTRQLEIYEGHFRRNFIHVTDVARAFDFALEHLEGMAGNTYNLGLSNANITKMQLAERIKDHLPTTKIVVGRSEDQDQRDYIVSNDKIEAAGFRPLTGLEAGIEELIKYYNTISNMYDYQPIMSNYIEADGL